MPRRKSSAPDGMQAATDVYAFLALVSLLLLAVARFQPATASDVAVGPDVQETFVELQLQGEDMLGASTRLDRDCEGPLSDSDRYILTIPLDGSTDASRVQGAWSCLSSRAPEAEIQVRWR